MAGSSAPGSAGPSPYTPGVNRERWTSFPAATEEERDLLAPMNGFAARRELSAVAPDGSARTLAADLSVEVAEALDGKADVVVRLAFGGAGLAEAERLADDPWDLLDRFLGEAVAQARRRAADAR